MRTAPVAMVALMAASVAWVAGNVALVAIAKPLFAHAPGKNGGGGTDFTTHQAAGAVFGDLLLVWGTIVSAGLLPALAVAAVAAAVISFRGGGKRFGYALLIVTFLAAASHVWSASTVSSANQLLAQLRSGQAEGSEYTRFHMLHRQSMGAMCAETLFVLVLATTAAVCLARASSPGKER